jgi:hypothetical protein
MTNERRFYTYAFLRRDGTPYYIGKGSGNRAFQRGRRKGAKLPKNKSRILFLKKGLTEKEAFRHEVYMIAVFGRKDLGTGILRNLTEGGEGMSGWVVTEGTREKMKKAARSKKVELTSMADGTVLIYDSLIGASRELNLNPSDLRNVCLGKQYSTGGFLARYWTPDLEDWGEGLFHKVEEVRKKKKDSSKKGPLVSKLKTQKAVELTGISDGKAFVFDSLRHAARDLNLNSGHLSQVCLGKRKSHKGFTARYL